MNRFLSSRLASKAGTRSAELIVHSDRAGDIAARVVTSAWLELFRGLKPGPHNYHANLHHATRIMDGMALRLWQTLHGQLAGLIQWSHREAAEAMVKTLPQAYLRAEVAVRMQESRSNAHSECAFERFGAEPLLEAGALAFGLFTPWNAPAEFTVTDFTDPLRHEPNFPFGAEPPALSPEAERDLFDSLLFPAPSADEVNEILARILPAGPWVARVGDGIATATPSTLANMVATTYALGGSTKQVAQQLRPYFDGSSMRATRTARTLGAFVGSSRGLAVDAGLGDLIVGWQVFDAFGENARPSHALRSGTIYYKNPKPGQYGIDVMPTPPQDTQKGPHDDMKAPHGLCFNCRCRVSPVLRVLPAMSTAAFTDNASRLIPAVADFQDWFAKAGPQQRNAAAGVRRIATAREILGREPEWSDMVDAKTGKLLTIKGLRSEGRDDRAARVQKVQQVIARNRVQTQKVAAFGAMVT